MLELKIKDTEVRRMLDRLGKNAKQIIQIGLKYLCEAIIARSVEGYLSGNPLHRRSGDLAQSESYRVSGSRATVFTNKIYARIHEKGGIIRPIHAKALRFEIGGQVIFAKKVTIPARPFLYPAITDTVGKEKGDTAMLRGLQEGIKRYGES